MQNNDCEKFKARLFDYASDMLSETESRELIEHINSCPECRAELAGIKAILSAAAEIENVKPSDELKKRISLGLAEEAQKIRRSRRVRIGRTAAAAVSLAACAALAVGIYSGGIYDKFMKADDTVVSDAADNSFDKEKETVSTPQQSENSAEVNSSAEENKENTEQGQTIPQADGKKTNNTPQAGKSKTSDKSSSGVNSEKKTKPEDTASEKKESNSGRTDGSKQAETEELSGSANAKKAESDTENKAEARNFAAVSEPAENKTGDIGASGGGSSARMRNESDTDGGDEAVMYSVSSAADSAEKVLAETLPVSCTVVCENPQSFAGHFGADGSGNTVKFSLSTDMWQALKSYAEECGAQLDAEFGENSRGTISVTVTKK